MLRGVGHLKKNLSDGKGAKQTGLVLLSTNDIVNKKKNSRKTSRKESPWVNFKCKGRAKNPAIGMVRRVWDGD